jgi:DedD protein
MPAERSAAEATRAQSILQGQSPAAAPAAADRVVVQVGAFADEARARETRQKLERAGLKTYTHVAQTADGRRIRVRLGPYDTRAEAEKVAERVKALGMPAAILTL